MKTSVPVPNVFHNTVPKTPITMTIGPEPRVTARITEIKAWKLMVIPLEQDAGSFNYGVWTTAGDHRIPTMVIESFYKIAEETNGIIKLCIDGKHSVPTHVFIGDYIPIEEWQIFDDNTPGIDYIIQRVKFFMDNFR